MAENWKMIRVKEATYARLMEEVNRSNREYHLGRSRLPVGRGDQITVGTVIQMLLDDLDDHRARAARQRGGRKPAKASEGEPAQEPNEPAECV